MHGTSEDRIEGSAGSGSMAVLTPIPDRKGAWQSDSSATSQIEASWTEALPTQDSLAQERQASARQAKEWRAILCHRSDVTMAHKLYVRFIPAFAALVLANHLVASRAYSTSQLAMVQDYAMFGVTAFFSLAVLAALSGMILPRRTLRFSAMLEVFLILGFIELSSLSWIGVALDEAMLREGLLQTGRSSATAMLSQVVGEAFGQAIGALMQLTN